MESDFVYSVLKCYFCEIFLLIITMQIILQLALRAGNEKEDGESADTVGCCSLRCEHIKLSKHLDGQDYVVEFDFLGKDSIRYYNKVPVLKQVLPSLFCLLFIICLTVFSRSLRISFFSRKTRKDQTICLTDSM